MISAAAHFSWRNFYSLRRYGYSWKVAEAEKNLLRTHTTAVSSRMLYKLAQEGFKPAKYFSIDRVFRNEAVDRTHLAEFHQIEGEPQPQSALLQKCSIWLCRVAKTALWPHLHVSVCTRVCLAVNVPL